MIKDYFNYSILRL